MKKIDSSTRSLEGFVAFPYIAWGLIIIFAYFVYNIALELKSVTDDLGSQSEQIQLQIDALEMKIDASKASSTTR
jgi:hypothetical protein